MRIKTALSANLKTYKIKGDRWSEEVSVDKLPSRIAFYRKLKLRLGGRYAEHYVDTENALIRLQQRLKSMQG